MWKNKLAEQFWVLWSNDPEIYPKVTKKITDLYPNRKEIYNYVQSLFDYSLPVFDIYRRHLQEQLGKTEIVLNEQGDTQKALNLIHQTDVDKALFDKKMLHYDKGLDHLDSTSFFYVLGLLGDVDPGDFIRKRLKGDARLEKNVRTLNNLFSFLPKTYTFPVTPVFNDGLFQFI